MYRKDSGKPKKPKSRCFRCCDPGKEEREAREIYKAQLAEEEHRKKRAHDIQEQRDKYFKNHDKEKVQLAAAPDSLSDSFEYYDIDSDASVEDARMGAHLEQSPEPSPIKGDSSFIDLSGRIYHASEMDSFSTSPGPFKGDFHNFNEDTPPKPETGQKKKKYKKTKKKKPKKKKTKKKPKKTKKK